MRIYSTISFVLFNGIAGSLGSKINLPFLCKEYVLSNINKESALHRTKQKKNSELTGSEFMVDDTRLELVTSRTSSGCATSCANRPYSFQQEVYYSISR